MSANQVPSAVAERNDRCLRVLFYKDDFSWPRSSGHDIHTSQMMQAMVDAGVRVALATAYPSPPLALAGLALERLVVLDDRELPPPSKRPALRSLEERFRSYWGVPHSRIAAFGGLAADFRADAVVVAGLNVLPMLTAITGAVRVWYAGDEWVWHHLSQARQLRHLRENVSAALIKGLYERAFRARVDRAWVVSAPDARALRWVAGIEHVDCVPNGVDTDHYLPYDGEHEPDTAVFWGRLDFGPNTQGLEWFVRDVWPQVMAVRPKARFTIIGFHPTPALEALARAEGVVLKPDLADIRPEVVRHAVVVLPFVSGGGVKNKLLEAAAMGKAIVASPRALIGLQGDPPLRVARGTAEWLDALNALWDDGDARRALGVRAREWVQREHTWRAAGRIALDGIARSLHEARGGMKQRRVVGIRRGGSDFRGVV
jgi:glycosyltransferase involved in cell wall biosynthesis